MQDIDLCKVSCAFGSKISHSGWIALSICSAIAVAWIWSLLWLLSWDLAQCSLIALVLGIWVRTFLHTGLFAIAHDAMHDNVLPKHPKLNRWIGRLALALYGCLPYEFCRNLHWRHHCYPAQARDPDFHEGWEAPACLQAVRWYFSFVTTYLSPRQLLRVGIGIALVGVGMAIGAKVALLNLILFWILPWCLSSVQLFFFGTYLPHHAGLPHHSGNRQETVIRSQYLPPMGSLLACYHFGYHWEHHAYPNLPWYRLPEAVRWGSPKSTGLVR